MLNTSFKVRLSTAILILLAAFPGIMAFHFSASGARNRNASMEGYARETNLRAASETSAVLNNAKAAASAFMASLDLGDAPSAVAEIFFLQNPGIGAFNLDGYTFINNRFFEERNLNQEEFSDFFISRDNSSSESPYGETLENISREFGFPMAYLSFRDPSGRSAGAFFSVESLSHSLTSASARSFLITREGEALAGDPALIAEISPLLEGSFDTPLPDGARVTGASGKKYFAVYQALQSYPALALTVAEYEWKSSPAISLAWAIPMAALSFLLRFSGLGLLTGGIRKSPEGEEVLRREEEPEIAGAGKSPEGEAGLREQEEPESDGMGKGLAEKPGLRPREESGPKAPESGAREATPEMPPDAASPEGESRKATVLFSRMNAFAALAEKLEPQETLEFLNDYMNIMAACVEATGGRVGYIILDTLLAVWSSDSPAEDALAAARAALLMRTALLEFNRERLAAKKARIRAGCGINSGEVIVGSIGPDYRRFPGFIGEAVNLASRAEELNKAFGADIVIAENAWKLVKDQFILEETPPVYVKGKRKPQKFFAVVNHRDHADGPSTLPQVRRLCGIPRPPDPGKTSPQDD